MRTTMRLRDKQCLGPRRAGRQRRPNEWRDILSGDQLCHSGRRGRFRLHATRAAAVRSITSGLVEVDTTGPSCREDRRDDDRSRLPRARRAEDEHRAFRCGPRDSRVPLYRGISLLCPEVARRPPADRTRLSCDRFRRGHTEVVPFGGHASSGRNVGTPARTIKIAGNAEESERVGRKRPLDVGLCRHGVVGARSRVRCGVRA